MTRLLLALLLCAAPAFATPWDVPDGNGGWKPNPDCTGSCRDTGIPDKPKPQPPKTPDDNAGPGAPREGYLCWATRDGKRVVFQHGEVEPGAEPVGECFCTSHPVGEQMQWWKGCR